MSELNTTELISLGTATLQSIELLQVIYEKGGRDREEEADEQVMAALGAYRHFQEPLNKQILSGLLNLVVGVSINDAKPLVLITRRFAPVVMLLCMICDLAGVDLERVHEGLLHDQDFPRITDVAFMMSKAPTFLCAGGEKLDFEAIIAAVTPKPPRLYLVCDWVLTGRELLNARPLSKKAGLTVVDALGGLIRGDWGGLGGKTRGLISELAGGTIPLRPRLISIQEPILNAIALVRDAYQVGGAPREESAEIALAVAGSHQMIFGAVAKVFRRVLQEGLAMPQRAVLLQQTGALWTRAVEQRRPVVWLLRRVHPVAVFMYALGSLTDVWGLLFLERCLNEDDFSRITAVAGRLGEAPVFVSQFPEGANFWGVLEQLEALREPVCLMCNWSLEGAEWDEVRALMATGAFTVMDASGVRVAEDRAV